MGPVFVFGLWAVIAVILAVLGLVVFLLTAFLTRGVKSGRRRALFVAGLLPAFGFIYAFSCVLIFGVWRIHTGRQWDWGQGDKSDIAIAGTYHLKEMPGLSNLGVIYDKKYQGTLGDQAAITRVQQLDVRPPFLYGVTLPDKISQSPVYFVIDTKTRSRTDLPSADSLEAAAGELRMHLSLKPVDEIYRQRFSAYNNADVGLLAVLALPPIIIMGFLGNRLRRLQSLKQMT